MKNNKGFTIIELIMSIAIVLTIVVFLTQIVVILKDMYTKAGIRTDMIVKQDIISRTLNEDFRTSKIENLDSSCSNTSGGIYCLDITYEGIEPKQLKVDLNAKIFSYGGYSTELVSGSSFKNPSIEVKDYGGEDKFLKVSIPIEHNSLKDDFGVYVVYQYNVAELNFDNNDWYQSEEEYAYTGSPHEITIQETGYYQVELWGAQGGNKNANVFGGKGAYTSGVIKLNKNEKIYLYVGGQGGNGALASNVAGYNGGGTGTTSGTDIACGGGGATDIRLSSGTWNDTTSLRSRIMVAAGGGGATNWTNPAFGGAGGALTGYPGILNVSAVWHTVAQGGTQVSGGTPGGSGGTNNGSPGAFGIGGNGQVTYGGGGGGGYYGGAGGEVISSGVSSASGGSSFVSGCAGCHAITESGTDSETAVHFSGKQFDSIKMIENDNSGNGRAKITFVGKMHTKSETIPLSRKTTYNYEGNGPKKLIVPTSGYYEIELFGAQGGNKTATAVGGKGGYTKGTVYLNKDEVIYLYIGKQGENGSEGKFRGGYNGGGNGTDSATTDKTSGGGGATDIRFFSGNVTASMLDWNNIDGLRSRIMVAGGGGGASNWTNPSNGGAGGSLIGAKGILNVGSVAHTLAGGGTQYAGGGAGGAAGLTGTAGVYGIGGNSQVNHGGGSGGGYFGGGGAGYISFGVSSGAGGSSFISGYAGSNATAETGGTNALPTMTLNTDHFSSKVFLNAIMKSGINEGNGKVTIKYVGESPNRVNTKLNNVRYIRSCQNTNNSTDKLASWVELQAIKDGVNVARNGTVTSTAATHDGLVKEGFIDGNLLSGAWTRSTIAGRQCLTVDLKQAYDLDEIALWLYWADNRIYYENQLGVSSDNSNWTYLHNYTGTDGYTETNQGRRYNAWNNNVINES